jgi:endonuclease YncB( thermonuclease family)
MLWVVAGLLLTGPAQARELQGKVIAVIDGETISVEGQETRVRLHGIAAPRLAQPQGPRAKKFLEGLLLGKRVRVKVTREDKTTIGAWVYVGGRCANEEMVRVGLAWNDWRSQEGKLDRLERAARRARRGMWRERGVEPVPPWEWDARASKSAPTSSSDDSTRPMLRIVGGGREQANCASTAERPEGASRRNCASTAERPKGASKRDSGPRASVRVVGGDEPPPAARTHGVPQLRAVGDEEPLATPAPGARPSSSSKDRDCRVDRDCAFAPADPCACPPCGAIRREVINRRALPALEQAAARRKCARPACAPCLSNADYRPVCVRARCTVR